MCMATVSPSRLSCDSLPLLTGDEPSETIKFSPSQAGQSPCRTGRHLLWDVAAVRHCHRPQSQDGRSQTSSILHQVGQPTRRLAEGRPRSTPVAPLVDETCARSMRMSQCASMLTWAKRGARRGTARRRRAASVSPRNASS